MYENLTPTDLSKAVSGKQVETPSYNWQTQVRYMAAEDGNYTYNSQATFSSSGQSCDATSDNND